MYSIIRGSILRSSSLIVSIITNIRLTLRRHLRIISTQARLSSCRITARMIIHATTSPQGCYLRCSEGGRWTEDGYVLCKRLILALHYGATMGGKPRKNDGRWRAHCGTGKNWMDKTKKGLKMLWKKCIGVISVVNRYSRLYLFLLILKL